MPDPVPLAASTDVASLAWTAVTAAEDARASLVGTRARPLDPMAVAVAYTSERWLRVDGSMPRAFAPLSGFFRAADGWVRTHANYPHHRRALLSALQLPAGADELERVRAELARRPAARIAADVTARGGLCVTVRPADPAVDEELRARALVETTRLADAPARPVPSSDEERPLAGTRVLDLTRVIAGPVASRTLALWGADVVRIDPPHLPELPWQHLDTGHGKRSALLDLGGGADRATFDALLASADVVVLGYRSDGLERRGVSAASLAPRRPGIIVLQLTAWPDPTRRGFDSLVQADSGIAWEESQNGDRPGALPAQALDHSAGYLLAAAALELLHRRAVEGGSWLASTNLRRIAAELLGLPRPPGASTAPPIDATGHLQSFAVDGVSLTTAAPAFPGARFRAPRPWGRDRAQWTSEHRRPGSVR